MKHELLSKDVRVTMFYQPVRSETTVRHVCSCNWTGEWTTDSDEARQDFETHLEWVKAEVA